MANLLADAAVWLSDRLKESAATTVRYKRGGVESDDITATRAEVTYDVVDADGYRHIGRSVDWIVTAAALVIRGDRITPRAGDEIAAGGDTYEVSMPADRPGSENEDSGGVMLRIHTVKVS